jgi:3-methyladenine DNA glycosylase AlkD
MTRDELAMTASSALTELERLGNPADAEMVQRYFRTQEGEYGEGDRFLGIRMPALRLLSRRFYGTPLDETVQLLQSPWHEARMLALMLLSRMCDRAPAQREAVFRAYIEQRAHINNWDLVDTSAPGIVGRHLYGEGAVSASGRELLTRLAQAESLWDRRIAIIATQYFIRQGSYEQTLRIAELLLHDKQDLIHKAVGWMLREVGNRDRAAEQLFLDAQYRVMPRTMLRYAIEKFPPPLRALYMGSTGIEPDRRPG